MTMPYLFAFVLSIFGVCCTPSEPTNVRTSSDQVQEPNTASTYLPDSITSLQDAALSLTLDEVVYDPSYYRIPYPNGDVAPGLGVCSDVVIRAYRKLNVDLQQLVHEDMKANFNEYPQNWGLKKPDTNIDHRRVPNLMKFFERKGASLGISKAKDTFKPGDVVAWNLGGAITHIGIVSGIGNDSGSFKIVHNIGSGQVLEDVLFDYRIIGHYRWKTEG